jgi:hypothetical protein
MKEDILKTLMGLGFITLVLFASVGLWTMIEHLFIPSEVPHYESVSVERPEEIQKAIDLPLDQNLDKILDPITAEEFEKFQLLNGLANDEVD